MAEESQGKSGMRRRACATGGTATRNKNGQRDEDPITRLLQHIDCKFVMKRMRLMKERAYRRRTEAVL